MACIEGFFAIVHLIFVVLVSMFFLLLLFGVLRFFLDFAFDGSSNVRVVASRWIFVPTVLPRVVSPTDVPIWEFEVAFGLSARCAILGTSLTDPQLLFELFDLLLQLEE